HASGYDCIGHEGCDRTLSQAGGRGNRAVFRDSCRKRALDGATAVGWCLQSSPRRGWGSGVGDGSLRRGLAEDDDIDAAVHAAAFGGENGGDRAILGVSGGAETIGTEPVPDDEKTHNLGGP